ncbi:hypothetical protein OY671_007718, partial [Metschnikowia pulcherrima]
EASGLGFSESRQPGPNGTFGSTDVPQQDASIRGSFTGPSVSNSDYTAEQAAADIASGRCDAVSFGRPFISNPDSVERFRIGAESAPNVNAPRSWYFPGPEGYIDYPTSAQQTARETKSSKAPETGAHAIIVDSEDAVAPAANPAAREVARGWSEARRAADPGHAGTLQARWSPINAIDTGSWREDSAAIMAGAPDGIVSPKTEGPDQVRSVSAELDASEQRHGLAPGSTRSSPSVSETAGAASTIPAYVGQSSPRLAGLTWGAEDLSAVLGATRKRDAAGRWTDTFRFVRAQTLLAAHASEVWPVDTSHADFRDEAGSRTAAETARADGFAGMSAIPPAQVPVINAAFAPTDAESAHARAIVDAFAANPGAGTSQIDGRMIDQPHLKQARQSSGIA